MTRLLTFKTEQLRDIYRRRASKPDAAGAFAENADRWFKMVRDFRGTEREKLAAGEFAITRHLHRIGLMEIIFLGEQLRYGWPIGRELPGRDYKRADLIATLDTLHETFRFEHGPKMSLKRRNGILALFNEPKSRA